MARTVTLRDVADRVGLSVSAVSMALLDHPRIGADAKARVREAADELGYVANSAGRALRAQRAGAISLIVPNTSQHVFGHTHQAVHPAFAGKHRNDPVPESLVAKLRQQTLHGTAAHHQCQPFALR